MGIAGADGVDEHEVAHREEAPVVDHQPAVADLDSLRLQEADFVTRSRQRGLKERVFDYSSQQVDEFLRIPESERRPDLYRSQETTPYVHPNGYSGPGLNLKDGILREGYDALLEGR